MGCISLAHFVVLVNGVPSNFFRRSRGLWQGCPLSPLLFLLIIEGLSLHIKKTIAEGKLVGVKISDVIKITHFFLWTMCYCLV